MQGARKTRQAHPIDGGDGGTHDPAMEARVARLESDIGEIKDLLRRLEPVLTKTHDDVLELKGRVAHMPSLWQIATTMLAINAGIVAVASMIVALLRNV